MRRRAQLALGVLAVALVGMLAVAAPGIPAARAQPGNSALTLSFTESSGQRSVSLECDPDGGTHPQPGPACDDLRAVDGHIEDMAPDGRLCLMIFDPVTLEASGVWRGERREFEHTYGNSCEASGATGHVFAF